MFNVFRWPQSGAIRPLPFLASLRRDILCHHERFDGKGYPDALAANDIPVCCRLIAVCDAWDAMTTDRPYKKALTREEALLEIKRCAGSQFHPDVVSSFLSMQEVQA